MNWKGLLGGVAVGVGATLKERADAAQKERLQEIAFAKEQVLRGQDQAFRSSEAEKSRAFEATQSEAESKRRFENESALLSQKNEYDAPMRAADIAAKAANAEESRARAKYYNEGGSGGVGGSGSGLGSKDRKTALERKADALVANELLKNPDLTTEEQADIRIRAIRGELNEKDDAKAVNSIYTSLIKEGARLPDGRRITEATPEEGVAHAKSIYALMVGQGNRNPMQSAPMPQPAQQSEQDGGQWIRDSNGKWVRK